MAKSIISDATALGENLKQIVSALSSAKADNTFLFFPNGINNIALKLNGEDASLRMTGPYPVTHEANLADGVNLDSIPEDEYGSEIMSALPLITAYLNDSETVYGTHSSARRYGIARTIEAINHVAREFHDRTGNRVGIGDISKSGGGKISGHASHQKGVDVDVRLPRADDEEKATKYQDPSYSREKTQILVTLFRENPLFPIKFLFFNDSRVRGVSPWPNHDNHLHVRFDLARLGVATA